VSAPQLRALESELGARPPDGLQALAADDLRSLTALLRTAKERQSQALDAAVEEALEIVPRMVRGPVRKILFG
jgi:hypothetical protein